LPFNASKLRGLSERLIVVNRRREGGAQRRNE